MAIWIDGFDHYTTLLQKYPYVGSGIAITAGRLTGNGSSDDVEFPVTAGTRAVFGALFRMKENDVLNRTLIQLREAASFTHVQVSRTSGSVLRVELGNGSVLATGTRTILQGVDYYLELDVTVHNSTGSFNLRINGVTEVSASGIDTNNAGAVGVIDLVRIGMFDVDHEWDNLYVKSGSDAADGPWGEVEMISLMPDGAGNAAQWTSSGGGGSVFGNVDEKPPNDGTDYNLSTTVGNKDAFTCENLPNDGTIYLVAAWLRATKSDVGDRQVRPYVRHSTSETNGITIAVSSSYEYGVGTLLSTFKDVPGGTGWTKTQVDATQIGYELIA